MHFQVQIIFKLCKFSVYLQFLFTLALTKVTNIFKTCKVAHMHSQSNLRLILPVPPRDRRVPDCEDVWTPPNTVTPCEAALWKLL